LQSDCLFLLTVRRQRISTLSPYTTLFRSSHQVARSLLSHNLHGLTFAIIIFSVVGLFLSSFDNIDPSTSANSRRTCFDKSFRISDRKSTRLNSSHVSISYAVFCLKKKTSD